MRTLFLLGILFALTVIAVKKPDQTAWDAVRDFQKQAEEVVAKADPPIVESLKPLSDSKVWKDVEETVTKAVTTLKETERPSPTKIENKKDTATPIDDWNFDPRSPAVEIAPKPAVSPLPEIQALIHHKWRCSEGGTSSLSAASSSSTGGSNAASFRLIASNSSCMLAILTSSR